MTKPYALILTEGGAKSGLGHVARCGAIYDAFSEAQVDSEVLVCGDEGVAAVLAGKRWSLFDWMSAVPQRIKVQYSDGPTIIFIDSYNVSDSVLTEYAQTGPLLVLLDDHARRNIYSGVVVTPVNFSEFLSPPQNARIHRLVGSKYIPLRRPFWAGFKRKIRPKIQTVFVSLGGSHARELYVEVLRTVRSEVPLAEIIVVCGGQDEGFLREQAGAMGAAIEIRSNLTSEEMFSIMSRADIAVAAGGQTLYELACMGVPSAGISIAANQDLAIRAFRQSGYLLDELSWEKDDLPGSIKRQLHMLRSIKTRQRLSEAGQNQIDGQGARRLAQALVEITHE